MEYALPRNLSLIPFFVHSEWISIRLPMPNQQILPDNFYVASCNRTGSKGCVEAQLHLIGAIPEP